MLPPVVMGAAPTVQYDCDEGTGTILGNSPAGANDGALAGATWTANGYEGGGVVMAAEGQRITIPSGLLSAATEFSIMAWVNPDATPVGSTLFDIGTDANQHLALSLSDGTGMKLVLKTATLDLKGTALIPLPRNRWSHVAVTLGAGQVTAFVDGRPFVRIATTLLASDLGESADAWVGQPRGTGTNFYGTVDDVRLYDRLVDPREISQIVVKHADYIYFTFDEACPQQVAAIAPAGMSATMPNGASIVPGRIGNAIEINVPDKIGQYVAFDTGIVEKCTHELTVATWVNLKTLDQWSRIFDFGLDETTFMYLTPNAGGDVRFGAKLHADPFDQSQEQLLLRPGFGVGSWHHVAVVLGTDNTGHLYIDGAEVATNTAITMKPSDMGSSNNNFLGRSQFDPDPYLSARLDDVVISCRAFTFDEIQLLAKVASSL